MKTILGTSAMMMLMAIPSYATTQSGKDNNRYKTFPTMEDSTCPTYDRLKDSTCQVYAVKYCSKCRTTLQGYSNSKCLIFYGVKNYNNYRQADSGYSVESMLLKRFLNSYESNNTLQYYSKEQQEECVNGYLRKSESDYFCIIPQGIKKLIFIIYYDLSTESDEMRNDLNRLLSLNLHRRLHVKLTSENPIYLIQLLQHINHKKYHRKKVKKLKEYLLRRISVIYHDLGLYACFSLQKKLIQAFMQVAKKSDYLLLEQLPSTDYDFQETGTYIALRFVLSQGAKKALQYSSIAGWAKLDEDLTINPKQPTIADRDTSYMSYARNLLFVGQKTVQSALSYLKW